MMPRCPTCESPDPTRHPAMGFEGEVQLCRDEWHAQSTNLTRGNADPYGDGPYKGMWESATVPGERQPRLMAAADHSYRIWVCPECGAQWTNLELGPGCHALDPIELPVVLVAELGIVPEGEAE